MGTEAIRNKTYPNKKDFRGSTQNDANGNICAMVANYPNTYTVPHPSDCTKFYMCQELPCNSFGRKCWKAHLMQCPQNTGFDTNTNACNWMRKLPSKCSKEMQKKLSKYWNSNVNFVVKIRRRPRKKKNKTRARKIKTKRGTCKDVSTKGSI